MTGLSELSSIFSLDDPNFEGSFEREGVEYGWKSDIKTRSEGFEVVMVYEFPAEFYESVSGYVGEENLPYEEPFTGQELYPSVDSVADKSKVVLWVPPPERPSSHEFAYFPQEHLDELREDFIEELDPFLEE